MRLPCHWAVYARTLGSVHVFTGQCTCVHRPVDDGKSAESGWNIGGKQLGIPYLTILVDHFSLCL